MSANKYNALNTTSINNYVNTQIDKKLKLALKANTDISLEVNELFVNDLSGSITNAIPQISSGVVTHFVGVSGSGYNPTVPPTVTLITVSAGSSATADALIDTRGYLYGLKITNPGSGYDVAPTVSFSSGNGTSTAIIDNKVNIYDQSVVPTYLTKNVIQGNWYVDLDNSNYEASTFGRLKYTGSEKVQVEVELDYTGDLAGSASNSTIDVRLYLNNLDVSVPIKGGRGYLPGTPITIMSGSGGVGCRAAAIISNDGNGRIQNIYIEKTGGGMMAQIPK